MHLDLNSCFATIEQQANPHLRGRPIAVAAYNSPNGCILAPSVEAKRFGVKTGMRVKDGRQLCPDLKILEPDPNKYRYVHVKLRQLLNDYTNDLYPKSIDEFVLNFTGAPAYKKGLFEVGAQIKSRIKQEIGDYITVSIGIAPNRFLAKTASNLQKPDGLCEINAQNHIDIYARLKLLDLCGIATNTMITLNKAGIFTVTDLHTSNPYVLHTALGSVWGYYWYLRLRGWEIEDYESKRQSFSNSYSLPKPLTELSDLAPILTKLVEKMSTRLRGEGYRTKGIFLYFRYKDKTSWHMHAKTQAVLFDTRDIYKEIIHMFAKSLHKPVTLVAVGCFNVVQSADVQLSLFEDAEKKERLVRAIDTLNSRWGNFVVSQASILSKTKYVHDRIGFGKISEKNPLEEW